MYKKFLKRAVDVTVSFLGILFLILPMLVISLLIKLDSKGTVFFKKRLGKNRKVFTIYKFRTMVPNAYEMGGTNTYENDPRITKVGAFLRKTSLDEVPQLFNILKGEMSIIGPRPILPEEFEGYEDNEVYLRRYDVLPGLFCSVDLDYRASASRVMQFEMDAVYTEEMSFILDTKLFFGVVKTVVTGSNVYKKSEGAKDAKEEELKK